MSNRNKLCDELQLKLDNAKVALTEKIIDQVTYLQIAREIYQEQFKRDKKACDEIENLLNDAEKESEK